MKGFVDVFIESNTVNNLHRPEGLVFGPDGNLYITSFLGVDANDVDKILVFDGDTGEFLDKIDLYAVGQPRAFAQAILFGRTKNCLFLLRAETVLIQVRYGATTSIPRSIRCSCLPQKWDR